MIIVYISSKAPVMTSTPDSDEPVRDLEAARYQPAAATASFLRTYFIVGRIPTSKKNIANN
jgi:hypothetical protein